VRFRSFGARVTRRFSFLLMGAGVAVLATAVTAGAVTAPVGSVTVAVSNGFFVIDIIGMPGTKIGPFTGTLTGTVDNVGKLTFPKSGVKFNSFDTVVVVPATVTLQATGNWSGTLDPSTGAATITGSLVTLATVSTIGAVNCPVGPVTVNGNSLDSADGAVKYNTTSGAATLAQHAFQIPALGDAGTVPGCNGQEGTINTALGLPGVGGFVADVKFSPVITGNGTPPPSTTTFTTITTTTTVPTTTPPTAAPTAPTSLPRTGSSSGPLTFVGIGLLGGGIALWRPRRRRTIVE
jgi:LPXTG-motif cell wall-anchored protein